MDSKKIANIVRELASNSSEDAFQEGNGGDADGESEAGLSPSSRHDADAASDAHKRRLRPSRFDPPPVALAPTHLWQQGGTVVAGFGAGPGSVSGLDFGSAQYQALHAGIDEILRTRGRGNHSTIVHLPAPPANHGALATRRPQPPTGSSTSGAVVRYVSVQTVPLTKEDVFGVREGGARSGKVPLGTFSSTRVSFITIFFVGFACAKFKLLLRRKTRYEQQQRYEALIQQSIRDRAQLIQSKEAAQYTRKSALSVVTSIRRDADKKFASVIQQSNERTRRVGINPRSAAALHNHATTTALPLESNVPSSTASPRGGGRVAVGSENRVTNPTNVLGDFLLRLEHNGGREKDEGAPPSRGAPGVLITQLNISQQGSPLLDARSWQGTQRDISSRAVCPPSSVFAHATDEPSSALRSPKASPGAVGATVVSSPVFGNGAIVVRRDSLPPAGIGYSNLSPRSLASTVRPPPIFEQFSDPNIFVMNTHWEDLQYIPLKERSGKTVRPVSQVHESALKKFTETVVPTSMTRIFAGESDNKKLSAGADHDGNEGASQSVRVPTLGTAGVSFSNPSFHPLHAEFVDQLGKANPAVDPALLVAYAPPIDEDGHRLMHKRQRSYDIPGGLRATASVAKPTSTSFNFYEWRVRQNRALFQHLCAEHNALSDAAVQQMESHRFNTKVLQSLRERVRKRAEDVDYTQMHSATETFVPFLIHRDIEHADFLERAQNEMERILEAKQSLTREQKRREMLRMLEEQDPAAHKKQNGPFSGEPQTTSLLSPVQLVERFAKRVEALDARLVSNLESNIIAENGLYNRQWVLTVAHRVALGFGVVDRTMFPAAAVARSPQHALSPRARDDSLVTTAAAADIPSLPRDCQSAFHLALEAVSRCSHRELQPSDFEEGVVNQLSADEMLSPACQFCLERLLPAFTTPVGMSPAESKEFLRSLFAKRKFPFALLTEDDETKAKSLYGLSERDRERKLGHFSLKTIQDVNRVMEPHLAKLEAVALNDMEIRHNRMRAEHRRLREEQGRSEDVLLEKAAALERRSILQRRRSTVVLAPLGVDGVSPATETRRASVRFAVGGEGQDNEHLCTGGAGGARRQSSVLSAALAPVPPPSKHTPQSDSFRRYTFALDHGGNSDRAGK